MNTSWLQSRINDLYALHKKTVEDYGELVQSLNQEAEIYCEIIPGYKITSNMMAQQQEDGEEEGNNKNQKKKIFNLKKNNSVHLQIKLKKFLLQIHQNSKN